MEPPEASVGGMKRSLAVSMTFVVQGEDVRLFCARGETIAEARHAALVASCNTGRPEDDFEPRTEAGRLLDPGSLVADLPDIGRGSPLVFLSLAVGAGGNQSATLSGRSFTTRRATSPPSRDRWLAARAPARTAPSREGVVPTRAPVEPLGRTIAMAQSPLRALTAGSGIGKRPTRTSRSA